MTIELNTLPETLTAILDHAEKHVDGAPADLKCDIATVRRDVEMTRRTRAALALADYLAAPTLTDGSDSPERMRALSRALSDAAEVKRPLLSDLMDAGMSFALLPDPPASAVMTLCRFSDESWLGYVSRDGTTAHVDTYSSKDGATMARYANLDPQYMRD